MNEKDKAKLRAASTNAIDAVIICYDSQEIQNGRMVLCGYDSEADMTAIVSLHLVPGKVDASKVFDDGKAVITQLEAVPPTLTLVKSDEA